jgi:hypothetical protein
LHGKCGCRRGQERRAKQSEAEVLPRAPLAPLPLVHNPFPVCVCSHALCRGLTQAQALMAPVHGIFDGRLAHDVKVMCVQLQHRDALFPCIRCFFNRRCSMLRGAQRCCVFNRFAGEGRRHHRAAVRRPQRQGHRGGFKGPLPSAAAVPSLTRCTAGQGRVARGWSQRLHR